MTSVYRERDRYDDARSVASTHRGDRDSTYTKVTRYVIREDDDARSTHTHTTHRHASPEREPVRETIRITRREVEDRESAAPRHHVPSYVEKEFVIRGREDSSSSPRRTERVEEDDRSVVVRRTTEHEGSRVDRERSENMTVSRVDDRRDNQRYEYDTYRAADFDRERDLARYSRTAEYYGPPTQQPQTIIIRQDPIIIRERIRDDDYQLVRKGDIDEDRSVASKSVAGKSVASRSVATTRRDREDEARDEQYFYEKRVRERFDEPPFDDYDRRSRREISPHDSISQVGRRRDRSYSSDDSMVYVKRVERDSYSRGSSRENKKDLAAGVIAGVGAAELVRNHRKKEGKETSSGIGRIGRDVGAGAIGAIAAEGIRRYRSKSRRRSHSRGRSESPYSRYGHSERRRSRSRSDSRSKLKTLGALGLGAVAVAAAASLATRKMDEKKKEQKEDRRSRSRRRRSSRSSRNSSVQSLSDLENDPKADDARNPKKRNAKVAAAGAIGAAGAALLERARSRSRAREGEPEEEKSRIEQGIPIVAAGLGTAALAGLYEKNKAKRDAEKIQQKEKDRARSRSRSQSQARQRGSRERSEAYYDDQPRNGPENNNWVEYGAGELTGNNYGAEYHPRPQDSYYGGESNAVVPARRTRSTSRSVSRDRREELRSRAFSPASGEGRRGSAAGAGAGGILAASEHERRKLEKRERKAREREEEYQRQQEAGRDPYEDPYGPQSGPQQPWTPPPPNDAYGAQQNFNQYQNQYQNQNQNSFPPPPGTMPPGMPNHFQPQYQPAPTPQPGGNQFPPQQSYTPQPYNPQAYPPPPQHNMPPGQQGFHNPFSQNPSNFEPPRNRGTPEDNVSAGYPSSQYAPPTTNDRHQFAPLDGVNNTRSLNSTPTPLAPNPSIHIQPPTNSSSTPNLDIPQTYVPPAERADTPPLDEHGNEKRVSFAPSPKPGNRSLSSDRHRRSDTMDSDDISPDASRQRRRNQETNKGYEASDDTDFSPNDDRHGSKADGNREPSRDRGEPRRSSSRRLNPEDNNYGARRRSGDSRRDKRSSRSGDSGNSKNHQSGNDSDTTIDLPDRFDDNGRKKSEKGEDPVADRIDDIMKGKGAAGKVFGNFMDGLLGPQGRRKTDDGSDAGESGSRRR